MFIKNTQKLIRSQKDYPKLLDKINDPPNTIFIRGNKNLLNQKSISIVGTRKNSEYGKKITKKIVQICCEHDYVIISGLAYGIDRIAHQSTLNNNGKTIAVLPGGINESSIYPAKHRNLTESILHNNGLLLSEYNDYTKCYKHHFLARNRIIAGLSQLTIVIEAPKKSGALITAYYALDYNREIAAVPYNIDQINGRGCNNLIKKGAHILTEPNDILQILNINIQTPIKPAYIPASGYEETILKILSTKNIDIDTLQILCDLPTSIINSTLIELELKGIIEKHDNMKYSMSI